MRGRVWIAAAVLTGMLAGAVARAQTAPSGQGTRRPMTFEDMMKMRRLGDIDVSRDGKWVLFSATDVDLEKNTRTPHLWIVRADGSAPETALTSSMAGESRGRFSSDGKQILFLTARSGGQQIWLADFNAADGTMGEPHQLTRISTEADGATWSPNGKHILFQSAVYPECSSHPSRPDAGQPGTPSANGQSGEDEDACDKRRDDEQKQSKVKAKIFTHLLYRHWNAFTDDKRTHLFLLSVDDGTFRDLNPGDTHDVPPFSLGEPDGWDFSPDGKEIAFEEKKVDDPALSTNVDIFTLRLDDPNAKPVKISTSPGGDFTPRYSPDGKWIAWRMQTRAGYESDRFRLVLYDRATKQIREVLPSFDRWVDEEAWGPDSKVIYFTAGDVGQETIFTVSLIDGRLIQETSGGEFSNLLPLPNGASIIVGRMTVGQPSEVFTVGSLHMTEHSPFSRRFAPGSAPDVVSKTAPDASYAPMANAVVQQISHLNDDLLSQLDLPKMESFWFTSIGNVKVQGFIIRPPGFDAHKKYPVKFLIHGGPQGAWGDSWSYRWNPELFAANGYVVVMINPGGSTGYGQAFVDRVNGDWGGRPFIDLMRGLDAAEQKYPFIDKTRECALGASYGGYMADWILGHTDRFKCIVSHDGMFNTESAYGTTDELWFNEWEFKGTPWTNPAMYQRWSPMRAETHFKTPTLVVHGQLDYRLDVSEGYQLFDTLQRMKVPSKMLYFPDEGHWVLKPQNSQLWYKTVNDWVDQWCKAGNRQ
jgi:dipeptidyl aminopeptidase/acylaminoacyl peptidase